MNAEVMTKIDLIRHGEPVGGRKFRGSVDDPLSEIGWAQMRETVHGHRPWTRIVTSPLKRCQGFAEDLATRLDIPLEIAPDLREISFGEWDGRSVQDIDSKTPEALSLFWQDPVRHPPPGGERIEAFARRVEAAWRTLLDRNTGEHVLVVCHGGVIRMVLCRAVLGMPLDHLWHLEVPYAAVSRVRIYHDGDIRRPVLAFHAGQLP